MLTGRLFRSRREAGAVLLLIAAATLVPAVQAQQQSGELRVRIETMTGLPVPGALVALIDAGDRVVTEGLSSEEGRRLLRAPAGSYRVRVRRIGFQPYVSTAVTVPRDGELLLRIDSRPVTLSSIVVSARSQCRDISDPDAVATLWEEVAKALRASQLSNDDLAGIARARTWRKETRLDGAVVRSDTTVFTVRDRRPFGAASPAELARHGYMRGNEYRGWKYFGPDETVLLSPEFAATHCFDVVRTAARPGEVGLAFKPVPRRRTSDIEGVLWLEESSSELKEVVFNFVNAGTVSDFDAGGFTRFRRMPSGAWLVADWQLRAPRLRIQPGTVAMVAAIGWYETGGGIINAAVDHAPHGSVAVVSGSVYDSLAGRPLAGATVLLDETRAETDGAGRFRFTGVSHGGRRIVLAHPRLSALGIVALERELDVRGDMAVVLALPSLESAWRRLCGDTASAEAAAERAILHGFVRDESGEPVAGGVVRVHWTEYAPSPGTVSSTYRQRLEVSTDEEGHYAACGFTRLTRGTAAVLLEGRELSRRNFAFQPGFDYDPVVRRDLRIARRVADLADSPVRRIIVDVTDSLGAPLADATVFLEESWQARSDDAGRAVLPAGNDSTVTITVRRIGYSERVVRVGLGGEPDHRVPVILWPVRAPASDDDRQE